MDALPPCGCARITRRGPRQTAMLPRQSAGLPRPDARRMPPRARVVLAGRDRSRTRTPSRSGSAAIVGSSVHQVPESDVVEKPPRPRCSGTHTVVDGHRLQPQAAHVTPSARRSLEDETGRLGRSSGHAPVSWSRSGASKSARHGSENPCTFGRFRTGHAQALPTPHFWSWMAGGALRTLAPRHPWPNPGARCRPARSTRSSRAASSSVPTCSRRPRPRPCATPSTGSSGRPASSASRRITAARYFVVHRDDGEAPRTSIARVVWCGACLAESLDGSAATSGCSRHRGRCCSARAR